MSKKLPEDWLDMDEDGNVRVPWWPHEYVKLSDLDRELTEQEQAECDRMIADEFASRGLTYEPQ
jgi:hypothetical protein